MDIKFEDAFQAITKINQIVSEFRNKYPEIKQKESLKISDSEKAFRIIKNIERIIKNYNHDNAEGKLKNLIAMLGEEIIK